MVYTFTMSITITSQNIDLTAALKDYTEKRLTSLAKFTGGIPVITAEIGKTTLHHKQGEVFRASATVRTPLGKEYHAVSDQNDLYAAIDDVRSELAGMLSEGKKKQDSLWRKGGRHIKRLLKGLR